MLTIIVVWFGLGLIAHCVSTIRTNRRKRLQRAKHVRKAPLKTVNDWG